MANNEADRLKIQSYCGPTLRSDSAPPETIIENFLWKEDAAMLLGSEKAGKSILAQQMFCSILTGEPFLGKFEVKKPGPIVYLQCEGKRDEFVDRLNNISLSFNAPFDDSKFLHIFKKYCPLNIPVFMEAVFEKIDAQVKLWGCNPVAICIDSVYKAIDGDLNENRDVIGFTNAIDELISRYKSAILLIHHDAKEWRAEKSSETIERGDKGAYGSVFLRAYVDHILYLKMLKSKARTLTCDTQRSGKTHPEVIDLLMIEPSPLVFQLKGDYKPSTEMIIHQLKLKHPVPLGYAQLREITGLAQITLQQGMSVLIQKKVATFVDSPTSGERFFHLKDHN